MLSTASIRATLSVLEQLRRPVKAAGQIAWAQIAAGIEAKAYRAMLKQRLYRFRVGCDSDTVRYSEWLYHVDRIC